jgi:hypothetical protein
VTAAPLVCRLRRRRRTELLQKRVASLLERIGNSAGAVLGEYITPADFSLQLSCSAAAAGNHHAMHNNIIIHGAIKETCGWVRIFSCCTRRVNLPRGDESIEVVKGDFQLFIQHRRDNLVQLTAEDTQAAATLLFLSESAPFLGSNHKTGLI